MYFFRLTGQLETFDLNGFDAALRAMLPNAASVSLAAFPGSVLIEARVRFATEDAASNGRAALEQMLRADLEAALGLSAGQIEAIAAPVNIIWELVVAAPPPSAPSPSGPSPAQPDRGTAVDAETSLDTIGGLSMPVFIGLTAGSGAAALLLLVLCVCAYLRCARGTRAKDAGGEASAACDAAYESATASSSAATSSMMDVPAAHVVSIKNLGTFSESSAHISLDFLPPPPPPPAETNPLPPLYSTSTFDLLPAVDAPEPSARTHSHSVVELSIAPGNASASPVPPPPPDPTHAPAGVRAAAPSAAPSAPAKIDGMKMATYMMPPQSVPRLGVGLPLQLSAAGKKRAGRKQSLLSKGKTAFGAPLAEYALGTCHGFEVPQILIALWCGVMSGGGLFVEGIFRLAPDQAECKVVEKALAKGKLEKASAVVLAHTIKKFLRELPGGLLSEAPTPVLKACGESVDASGRCGDKEAEQLYASIDHTAAQTLAWAVHIMATVQEVSEKNKMNLRNLALVIAPNLFGPASAAAAGNPIEELLRAELAINALHRLAAREVASRVPQ